MEDYNNKKPENHTRVLIRHASFVETLEFAYYKDGMFKCDSGTGWMPPSQINGWMSIHDLRFKILTPAQLAESNK